MSVHEPQHVQDARRVIREWELRDGHHVYVASIAGGYRAACDTCDWRGEMRLPTKWADDTWRVSKRFARADAEAHRQATIPKSAA